MYITDNDHAKAPGRRVDGGTPRQNPKQPFPLSPKIWRVRMFLDQFFARPLTLRDAAAVVDLHPDYLSRRFKYETGIGFHEYLLTVRLRHATALLVTSTRSIKEIAYEVGFRAPEVFSKAFTRSFSCAPSTYRNHNLVFYETRSPDGSRADLALSTVGSVRERSDLVDCIVDCGEQG